MTSVNCPFYRIMWTRKFQELNRQKSIKILLAALLFVSIYYGGQQRIIERIFSSDDWGNPMDGDALSSEKYQFWKSIPKSSFLGEPESIKSINDCPECRAITCRKLLFSDSSDSIYDASRKVMRQYGRHFNSVSGRDLWQTARICSNFKKVRGYRLESSEEEKTVSSRFHYLGSPRYRTDRETVKNHLSTTKRVLHPHRPKVTGIAASDEGYRQVFRQRFRGFQVGKN